MAQYYTHEALEDENSLRLLRIDSVSETEVRCTLRQVRTISDSQYLALSYCWGDDLASRKIQINGSSFLVRDNLFIGLKALYRQRSKFETSWIFVDAICLNQNDNAEKSSQVGRMADIYKLAKCVVVWLGEDADNSQCVMKVFMWLDYRKQPRKKKHRLLSNISSLVEASRRKMLKVDGTVLQRLVSELKMEYDISEASLIAIEECLEGAEDGALHDSVAQLLSQRESVRVSIFARDHWWWKAFLLFKNRRWFYRVWTFQEIRLASRAMVLCGNYCVSWEVVLKSVSHFHPTSNLYDFRLARETIGTEIAFESYSSARYFSVPILEGRESFRKFLLGVPGRNAKDPKDFIYGYLGLLGDAFKSLVRVNYDLPASQIFKDAIVLACQGESGGKFWVDIMESYMCVPKSRVQDLPSWCPDFSCKAEDTTGASFALGDYLPDEVSRVSFNRPLRLSNDRSQIQIFGMTLDTIISSSNVTISDNMITEETHSISDVLGLVKLSKDWLDGIYCMFSRCEQVQDLSKSWLQNYMYQDSSESQKYGLNDLRECCVTLISTNLDTYEEAVDLSRDSGWSLVSANDLFRVVLRAISRNVGRYFFVTQSGRIGFSPKQTVPGQRLCYFPGGGYLQILSPQCDEYITSAFVDRFMGTGLENFVKEENLREFTLH